MRRFLSFLHDERGVTPIVEATIILPLCLMIIISLYYAAVFTAQRANLEAALEDTLIYYKNQESDSYVSARTRMDRSQSAQTGSNFEITGILNPYRSIHTQFSEADFISFFRETYGHQFFASGNTVRVKATCHNYVIYKTIEATAEVEVRPAVSLKMAGLQVGPSQGITYKAASSVVITDGDNFIRNTDLVLDILTDLGFKDKFDQLVGKVSEIYTKFKDAIGA